MHNCCVCYERTYELLPCTHPVCTNCQRHLRDRRCPMCRPDVTTRAFQNLSPFEHPTQSGGDVVLKCVTLILNANTTLAIALLTGSPQVKKVFQKDLRHHHLLLHPGDHHVVSQDIPTSLRSPVCDCNIHSAFA